MNLTELIKIIKDSRKKANPPITSLETFEEFKINLLISILPIEINLVEIKECKNRNNDFGVFATQDIKQNSLITLYPAHTIGGKNSTEHFTRHILKISLDIIISGNPEIISTTYCGHMCNDGAKYDGDERKIQIYETMSKLKKNANIVVVENIIPCVIATKDIKAGEEILLYYGTSRWLLLNQVSSVTTL